MPNVTRTGPLAGLSEEELGAAGITPVDQARDYGGIHDWTAVDVGGAVPPVPSSETIRATPLTGLPALIRAIGEREAQERRESWRAYQHYRQCFARLSNHYHEVEKLQITAAQSKAETDAGVIDAMIESRRCWETWQTAKRARVNAELELRARITSEEHPDPSSVAQQAVGSAGEAF
jgi:hypothetical protein